MSTRTPYTTDAPDFYERLRRHDNSARRLAAAQERTPLGTETDR